MNPNFPVNHFFNRMLTTTIAESKRRRAQRQARKHTTYNTEHQTKLIAAMRDYIGHEFMNAVGPYMTPNYTWQTGIRLHLQIPGHLTMSLTFNLQENTLEVNGTPITRDDLTNFALALQDSISHL